MPKGISHYPHICSVLCGLRNKYGLKRTALPTSHLAVKNKTCFPLAIGPINAIHSYPRTHTCLQHADLQAVCKWIMMYLDQLVCWGLYMLPGMLELSISRIGNNLQYPLSTIYLSHYREIMGTQHRGTKFSGLHSSAPLTEWEVGVWKKMETTEASIHERPQEAWCKSQQCLTVERNQPLTTFAFIRTAEHGRRCCFLFFFQSSCNMTFYSGLVGFLTHVLPAHTYFRNHWSSSNVEFLSWPHSVDGLGY